MIVNNSDVTSNVTNNQYSINNIQSNTTVEVEFETIPPMTYSLSIKATGNGSATFNGTIVRNTTKIFTVDEGTTAIIAFTPDNGYKIKSVKVNGTDKTPSVSNGQYSVSNISIDITVEVEFEAITHNLSIKASGNGVAEYNGTSIRNKTTAFTVNDGSSATVKFTPDDGYRIKSVMVNSTDVTSSISDDQYTVSNIQSNTTVSVVFEHKTHSLTVRASGNGIATYNGTAYRNESVTLTVNEGTSATIYFTPDNGYRIESVKVNSANVTSNVSNSQYTIGIIQGDTTVEVEFEAIPPTTYSLFVTATGYGYALYNSTTIRNTTKTFTVNQGTSATITLTPDAGYMINSVKKDGVIVTSNVVNNQYTINSIQDDTTVEVEFEAITHTFFIKATGNGVATYDGTNIRNKTTSFSVNDGSSAIVKFTPDNGYRIKNVKVNSTNVISNVANNQYTISNITADTTLEVEFEAIPPTTYTLTIKATGNGSASYNSTTVRNTTKTFTVNEGTSATISFTPDSGYKIKSVKRDGTVVTSNVSNNKYTISNIQSNTTVEVEFEPITYTLSIKASGNGVATYDGTNIRNKTTSFTVNEGSSAIVKFTPDNGYRIKNVKVNSTNVTSNVANNQYTISNITADTTLEVEFEAIPPTTYALTITAAGSGSASYNSTIIRNTTETFSVNEGLSATVKFTPDNGYRIKNVKVNSTSVTSNVANNQYTISNITADTTLEVEFEAIPPTTYALTITATGNGSASYNSTTVRNTTKTFTVNEGTSATITFTPDNGYKIKSVKRDGTVVTSNVSNNKYTISNIQSNTTVEVEFEAITHTFFIKATGNGVATYDGTNIRNKTTSFTLNEGSSAVVKFTPDNGCQIRSVKVNSTDVTSSVYNNQYTISNITANISLEVEFEPVPSTTYSLSITAIGNGVASYDNISIRNSEKTYIINEGTNAIISFVPDNGNRIKKVKVNNVDRTSSVSNSQLTVSNVSANTTVSVEFEAIPTTTYTLTISATGYGSATYANSTIRNDFMSYSVNEGTSHTITFTPDTGYRVKSLMVNGVNRISWISNNQYTVNNISTDTTVAVEFEVISTTYTLTISATGNGKVSYYSYDSIRNTTQSFTVNAGSSHTISFSPDNGCRIKSVKVNGIDRTSSIIDNHYTVSNISENTTVAVEFETIPPTTYTLTISATGNGNVYYKGSAIRSQAKSFSIENGATVSIFVQPDNNSRIETVKKNGASVYVIDNQYTVYDVSEDVTIEVVFEDIPTVFSVQGINYKVTSYDEKTIRLTNGNYGTILEVPVSVIYDNRGWIVTGVDMDALNGNSQLAAIIWHPNVQFTASASNPNQLLYVNDASFAATNIANVVVGGVASNIVLTDANSVSSFYCPQEFMAERIRYSHRYGMTTGIGESRGWETIALPFDVQRITHEEKGEVVPFARWKKGDSQRPFWLKTFGASGWTDAETIVANTPYIISMPNNDAYKQEFILNGTVTFAAENVLVRKTVDIQTQTYNGRSFIPAFTEQTAESDCYALNVINDLESDNGGATEGSRFILNLRKVHPFEAYMTTPSGVRYIAIDEGTANDVMSILTNSEGQIVVFNLNGQLLVRTGDKTMDEVKKMLPAGVYVVNGRKMMVK